MTEPRKVCLGGGVCQPGELPCRHWGADMDMDAYCVHPTALEQSEFGLYTRVMDEHGCGRANGYALWELDPDCRECRNSSLWKDDCTRCRGTGKEPDLTPPAT